MAPVTLFWLQTGPLLAGGVAALIADTLGYRRSAVVLAAVGAFLAAVVGLYGGWAVDSQTVFDTVLVGAAFSTVPGVIGLLTALTLVGSIETLAARRHGGALAALLGLAAAAAALTATAIDLVALLLAIETAALASYAFVSAARDRRGDESAMKYYIQGAVSTGLLVLGVAVLVGTYASDGSYVTLAGALAALQPGEGTPALLGVVLLATAFAFKSGAAPFHSWTPDAYENAPSETAAFMAGPLKAAFLFAGMLLLTTAGPAGQSEAALLGVLGSDVLPLVGILGGLSVIVGSLGALGQRSYGRMLGYAGVAQVGYALIATAAVSSVAVTVFSVTYAVAVTGAFVAVSAFRALRPSWDGTVEGLAGIGRRSPLTGIAVTTMMVSLAGLPPLLGFWGKFEVFVAALGAAQQWPAAGSDSLGWLFGALAVVGLAGSVVSLAYYGRVVRVLFSAVPESSGAERDADVPWTTRAVLAVMLLIVLAAGLVPLVIGIGAPMQGFLLR